MPSKDLAEDLTPTTALIIGAGPTGCMLAHCLTKWGHSVRLVDNRSSALSSGRADGIQPHTLDVLINAGLGDDFTARKPGCFDTVAFWDPSSDGAGIEMTSKAPTCPPEVGARHPYTATLHQGHIEDMFLTRVEDTGGEVLRPWTIEDWTVEEPSEYPVNAQLQDIDSGRRFATRAKYLIGAQGGRSSIRDKMDVEMEYYTKSLQPTVWGVVDAEIETDFPGVKWKNNIHSRAGAMMVIPRENGLVRFYVQSQRGLDEEVPEEETRQLAQKMLRPYELRFGRCDWASTYKVGQGRAKSYCSPDLRVFLGGDTCHTHSPKAGQGMNTGILDAVDLAWKVHLVERGLARRAVLQTYESERAGVARALLDFDAAYTKLFSERRGGKTDSADEDAFVKTAAQNVQFTSGHGTQYGPSMLVMTSDNAPSALRPLLSRETTLRAGALFPAADLRRQGDGRVVRAEQALRMTGAFGVWIYAGHADAVDSQRALADFSQAMVTHGSRLAGLFETAVVFASVAEGVKVAVPAGSGIEREQVYTDDAGTAWSAYGRAGMRADKPAVIIVRPDGYVGCVLRLEEAAAGGSSRTAEAVRAYFDGILPVAEDGPGS